MLAVMRAPLHDIAWSPLASEIDTPAWRMRTYKKIEHALSPMLKACEAAARTIANTPRAKQQRSKIEHAKALCMTYSEQLALVTPEATSAKQKPTLQQPPGIAWHVSSNAPNIFMSYPRKKGTPIKS